MAKRSIRKIELFVQIQSTDIFGLDHLQRHKTSSQDLLTPLDHHHNDDVIFFLGVVSEMLGKRALWNLQLYNLQGVMSFRLEKIGHFFSLILA
jgi:hypothetical protein